MTNSRANILNRIREASTGGLATDRSTVIPAHALPEQQQAIAEHFISRAEVSGAVVRVVPSVDEQLRIAEVLARAVDAAAPDRSGQYGSMHPADISQTGADRCVVARADSGIAETGTVCLRSDAARNASLFLCDHLVVLIDAVDIVRYQEDYWHREPKVVPGALHLITGPSRTADVEQTIQIGAHGPGSVTILLHWPN